MSSTPNIREQMAAQLADKSLLEQAKSYAYDYIDGVAQRNVFPDHHALEELAHFDESLPEEPSIAAETLEMLAEYGSPATTAQIGGRYFGFVNGNAIPTAVAARWLADIWDQNGALNVMSPIVGKLEQVCEKWSCELLGLPTGTVAGLVSGTSIATLCGLAAGRNALLEKKGWYVGERQLEYVHADEQGRIEIESLPQLDSSTLLILQAGNVNSGAFDDFESACELAEEAGAWVHIDGAFGLWAAASPNQEHLTRGIERADSWSVDGHKTLNTPYDCALVLCKHPDALAGAMQATGSYLQYGKERDNMLYTPDMSRRARAVDLWATLRYLGKSGVAELIDGLCIRATQFAELLAENGFNVLNDVVFNQVLVACDTPEETRNTLEHIQASGECWCGGTDWRMQPAIRISVCSWATTAEDVERSVQAFVKARAS